MKRPSDPDLSAEQRKLLWRSRRGLLELDLLLTPFVEDCFELLTEVERTLVHSLLSEEDTLIMAWLNGSESPAEPELRRLIGKIMAHARAN